MVGSPTCDAAGAAAHGRSALDAGTARQRRSGVGADVGTEAGNVALIEAADGRFGPIDLFFANAGVGIGSRARHARGGVGARRST